MSAVAQAPRQQDSWRGVAAEELDEFSPNVAGLLRQRSRRLLAELARPYRPRIVLAGLLIVLRSVGYLSIPYLVKVGIDRGISTHDLTTLMQVVGALLVALALNALANFGFLRMSGAIGAAILFDLRRKLFAHVQELSLSFYERYTSGRIISRLTSDISRCRSCSSSPHGSAATPRARTVPCAGRSCW